MNIYGQERIKKQEVNPGHYEQLHETGFVGYFF